MEQKLKDYLNKFKVDYKVFRHRPVFTVQEAEFLKKEIQGLHTKNLFMRDDKGNFYLVCMEADKRLDIRALRKHLHVGKLHFADQEELRRELNLTPGSVSLFGMIHAGKTRLVLDAAVWKADMVSFHANINTETLKITHDGLKRFFNSLQTEKEIVELG